MAGAVKRLGADSCGYKAVGEWLEQTAAVGAERTASCCKELGVVGRHTRLEPPFTTPTPTHLCRNQMIRPTHPHTHTRSTRQTGHCKRRPGCTRSRQVQSRIKTEACPACTRRLSAVQRTGKVVNILVPSRIPVQPLAHPHTHARTNTHPPTHPHTHPHTHAHTHARTDTHMA